MAVLQTLRNKAGLIVSIVIGLALLAFILGDMLRSGRSLMRGNADEIAEINGNSIRYNDYNAMVEQLTENYKRNTQKTALTEAETDEIRQQAWETLVKDNVMNKAYEQIGIDVTPDEVFEMVQGKFVSPLVKKNFTNPNTGIFDRSMVIRFLKTMDQDPTGNAKISWLSFEKVLIENRKLSKFFNLISKGYYVPKAIAQKLADNANNKANIQYVSEPYALINDSSITVSDDEIEKFYNEHQKLFIQQQETRDLEYVIFNIIPSQEDSTLALKWTQDIVTDFKMTNDDVSFVNLNSDVPFDRKWYKKGVLPERLDTFAFNADTNSIYGPYLENGAYKLVKISKREMLPDSLKARHILIQPSEKLPYPEARKLADSLKTLLQNGADFAQLAHQYSADKKSLEKDGDLGWFALGQMVPSFEDSVLAAKVGDIITATSQFGIHIIEVEGRSEDSLKVQLATLVRNIEPTSTTRQFYYSIASKFAGENNTAEKFDAACIKENLTKRFANNLKPMDKTIAGLDHPREIVKWAFNTEEAGSISNAFELDTKFVVAKLATIHPKGIAPIDDVKKDIEVVLKRRNKGKKLAEKLNKLDKSSLSKLALQLKKDVNEANSIAFTSFVLPSAGVEPQVIAAATTLKPQTISEPIIGNNAVFVIQVTKNYTDNAETIVSEQQKLEQDISYRVNYQQAYDAMKKAANIKDERIKFF